jgi:hypothetical protein
VRPGVGPLERRELAVATEENVRSPALVKVTVSVAERPAAIAPVRRAPIPKARARLVRLWTVNTSVPVGTWLGANTIRESVILAVTLVGDGAALAAADAKGPPAPASETTATDTAANAAARRPLDRDRAGPSSTFRQTHTAHHAIA